MKKIILLTLCITGLLSCNQKRPAVVERPVFEIRNNSTIEIDKIEMSDTATILHIDAYAFPGYQIGIDRNSFIRESGSDEKLILTHVEGISMEEMTVFPESGAVSFKLFFPPLRPDITKIDYVEDVDQGWKIMGIHLLPDAKIMMEPVPNDVVNTGTKPLPAPAYSTQPVQVNGRILGYMNGMDPKNITIYTMNIVTGQQNQTEFALSDDGSFSGEVIPGMPGLCFSSIGNFFLVPGEEMKVYYDLKKRGRLESRYRTDKEAGDSIYTYISGYFTKAELDSINLSTRGLFDYQKLYQEIVNMKPEEFKQHILGIMNKHLDAQKQKNYPPNVQMMVENTVKLSVYMTLLSYERLMKAAYIQVNDIKPEERNNIAFVPDKPGDDYYSFLKGQITDNMSYLSGFYSLVSSLTNLFGLPDGDDKPAKERFAYFKEKIAPVLGADKGILFDMVQVKYYGSQIGDMKFYTDAEKQEIRDAFKDTPVYAEALIAENDKMETLLTANKANKTSILNALPQTSQEKMFDAIIANYKGKVVLVDFWATWCGPCMIAMKSILPMKEEMKGKDVVFLYLTGETSPLGDFTKTYPTIAGEHYRVSAAQWSYWMTTFNIPGIPTYMIYDRQGKQLGRHLGFPGVDTIRKDIEKGI